MSVLSVRDLNTELLRVAKVYTQNAESNEYYNVSVALEITMEVHQLLEELLRTECCAYVPPPAVQTFVCDPAIGVFPTYNTFASRLRFHVTLWQQCCSHN